MELQTLVSPDPAPEKERSLLTLPPEKGPLSWHINGDRYPARPSSRYLFPNSVSSQPRSRRVIPYGGAFVMRRRAHGQQRTAFVANTPATKSQSECSLDPLYKLNCNPPRRFSCRAPRHRVCITTNLSMKRSRLGIVTSSYLAGEPAGAKLAVGLLRYVADKLPHPRAAILGSHWIDLRAVIDPDRLDKYRGAGIDYLPGRFTAWGARE